MSLEITLHFLESHVREFDIVSSGPYFVTGGFGKLPFGNSPEERIRNLYDAISAFDVGGSHLTITGDFQDGLRIE